MFDYLKHNTFLYEWDLNLWCNLNYLILKFLLLFYYRHIFRMLLLNHILNCWFSVTQDWWNHVSCMIQIHKLWLNHTDIYLLLNFEHRNVIFYLKSFYLQLKKIFLYHINDRNNHNPKPRQSNRCKIESYWFNHK